MLHIVLLILKIIGIVLGVLIGIVLFGLCLVLFVPVRYRIEAKRTEQEGGPPVEAMIKITWLLHFVNVRVLYPSEIYLRVRILFITLFRLPKKQKKVKKEKETKKEKKRNDMAGQEEAKTAEHESGIDTGTEKAEQKTQDTDAPQDNKVPQDQSSEESSADTENGKQKQSIKEKLIKIYQIFQNIWYTITGICDKIKAIWENIEYYLEILKSNTFKQAFSLCKDELISILSYMKPRKFNAELIIGMENPASTGQILSYCGMLYPFIGNYVTVEGDFENKRIEGTVFIKGKIKLFTFIKAAIRIYFNKDIRKLLKLFKKEDV